MKRIVALMLTFFMFHYSGYNQQPFEIVIEPFQINGLNGLQAYAFGQSQGKWLVVGGRLDGLHKRQPFASFDTLGNNNKLFVVDPVAEQVWSASISSLPIDIQEQLSATNMEFHQDGPYLYILGGYGYDHASSSKKTFDNLMAIDVPAVINAVQNNSILVPYFRQIAHSDFAVTGGHLKKINHTYYLLGGNRFDGDYNPMGMPTYTQQYTNAVRRFTITDDGVNLTVNHLSGFYDSTNLHRRDYNALAQIRPDGSEGITMFSGVFQPVLNLPYLNCVEVDSTGIQSNTTFQQHYNHYHCASIPLYAASSQEMHTVFFGGIAQFYDSAGVMVQDNDVPFVKTIARVTRNATGIMSEHLLPVSMPGYLGSASEFIPVEDIPTYSNEVIKLDSLTNDSTLLGYIYGGISSPNKNIFAGNGSATSSASQVIYKVFLLKNNLSGIPNPASNSSNEIGLVAYPVPGKNPLNLQFHLTKSVPVKVLVQNQFGEMLFTQNYRELKAGLQTLLVETDQLKNEPVVLITLIIQHKKYTLKVIR